MVKRCKVNFEVAQFTHFLDLNFGTQTVKDEIDLHPVKFCQKCFYHVDNHKKVISIPTLSPFKWLPHSSPCSVCSTASRFSKGGRPKKTQRLGRPKQVRTVDDIMNLDPRKPIPYSVEKCLSHVMTIKMNQSDLLNNSIQIKSNGPRPFTPITIPQKNPIQYPHVLSRKEPNKQSRLSKWFLVTLKKLLLLRLQVLSKVWRCGTRWVIKKPEHQKNNTCCQYLNIPWNLLRIIRSWLGTFNVKLSWTQWSDTNSMVLYI